MARIATTHEDLDVYQRCFDLAGQIFELTGSFPKEERYALTDQIRRSSRSVCANLAEAWRKRRYRGAFIAKLSDVEAELAETQVWLSFADRCGYLDSIVGDRLRTSYDSAIRTVVNMILRADDWLLPPP